MLGDNIIFSGQADPADLIVAINDSNEIRIDPEVEAESNRIWKELVSEAKAKGAILFDSNLYRLNKVTANDQKIVLELSYVKYSFAKTAPKIEKLANLDFDCKPNSIFTAGLIMTSDGYYVFGRRGATVSGNAIDMIGGVLSADEQKVETGTDIFNSFYREVEEELGVSQKNTNGSFLKSLFYISKTYKYCFLFDVKLSIDLQSLNELFTQRQDKEMAEVVAVSREQLKNTLLGMGGYKLVVAELLD